MKLSNILNMKSFIYKKDEKAADCIDKLPEWTGSTHHLEEKQIVFWQIRRQEFWQNILTLSTLVYYYTIL
jgi:hypothetical protein